MEQHTAVTTSVPEKNPEIEQLELECYTELLDCCKTMAIAAGVNYTSIMNLLVCLPSVVNYCTSCNFFFFCEGSSRNVETTTQF